jgi:hypothetical protein
MSDYSTILVAILSKISVTNKLEHTQHINNTNKNLNQQFLRK